MLNAVIKGADTLKRDIAREKKRAKNTVELALRVEGFRLRKEMQDQLRNNGLGLDRLTFLARGLNIRTSRRLRKDRPLVRMAAFVRYHVKQNPYQVRIGFTGPRVPREIKGLVKKHEKGFSAPITKKMRRFIVAEGARRGTVAGGRTPFFLKKSTRVFKTPARPIVEPFWRKEREQAIKNIRNNFRLKMRGQRI